MKNIEDYKIKNLDDFNNQREMAANEPELFWSGIAMLVLFSGIKSGKIP